MNPPGPLQMAVTHPTGNRNVRAALTALQAHGMLHSYWTGLAWRGDAFWSGALPSRVRRELERRTFAGIPHDKLVQNPGRELVRLTAQRLFKRFDRLQTMSLLRADEVNRAHDAFVARRLRPDAGYQAIAAPIGASQRTFARARELGLKTVLDVTSAYHRVYRHIIRDEADRMPAWASTLEDALTAFGKPRGDDAELSMADLVVAPSTFVAGTLCQADLHRQPVVIPYGCPDPLPFHAAARPTRDKLKVLFVGSLTQAKGLSYMFEALAKTRAIVDATVVGGLRTRKCGALNDALAKVRWFAHLPHADILRLMAECDVLIHPSLSEGMALVVGEAMSRSCPVIVTANAGNDFLVRDGENGIVVPIRDAAAIEQALVTLAADRDRLGWMARNAQARAAAYSDAAYGNAFCDTVAAAFHG